MFKQYAYLKYSEVEEYISKNHNSKDPSTVILVNAPQGSTIRKIESGTESTSIIVDARNKP